MTLSFSEFSKKPIENSLYRIDRGSNDLHVLQLSLSSDITVLKIFDQVVAQPLDLLDRVISVGRGKRIQARHEGKDHAVRPAYLVLNHFFFVWCHERLPGDACGSYTAFAKFEGDFR